MVIAQGEIWWAELPVANVTQIIAIDRSLLTQRISRISQSQIELLWQGLDVLFGR